MAKSWTVRVAIPLAPQIEEYVITEGDDWDGRPVADMFDAGDLAYDKAYENFPNAQDIEVIENKENN